MRRWIPILLIGVAVLVLASWNSETKEVAETQPSVTPTQTLVVYTDMSHDMAETISYAYLEKSGVRLEMHPMPIDRIVAYLMDSEALRVNAEDAQTVDLVWGSEMLLRRLEEQHLLRAYTSEHTDIVDARFKNEDGLWVGTWYVPLVLAVREEYYREYGEDLRTWADVTDNPTVRLAMTDFMAADMTAELLYSMVEVYGEERAFDRLRDWHRHMAQYAKYLTTPVRMLALQKADVAIADAESVRTAIADNLPVRMVYPQDGTAYYLYGMGIPREAAHVQEAQQCVDRILSGYLFGALQHRRYYFYYTGYPGVQVVDAHREEPVLWPTTKQYTEEGKQDLRSRWLREVRFAQEE